MSHSPTNTPILDRPDVLRVLFHPRREEHPGVARPGVVPLTIPVAPGIALGARLYPAGSESPAVLYFHGNGEIAADYDDLAACYTRLGITLLVADYRGYGTSCGSPTSTHLLADAVALFGGLESVFRAHVLAPSRTYCMGRSLGSAAAVEVAVHASGRLAGLIVESGLADTFGFLRRAGLPVPGAEEERDGFGSASKLSRVWAPTLILHGRDDRLIPATDGQEMYRRSAAADKHLLLIPGAGHNDLMFTGFTAYFEAIRALVHGPAAADR